MLDQERHSRVAGETEATRGRYSVALLRGASARTTTDHRHSCESLR
jgi:hypothetical protein